MNYHNIYPCDCKNGDGIRVSLFVSGCEFHCKECFNSETWSFTSGIPFDEEAEKELMDALDHDYIKGLSVLGGEPLHPRNLVEVTELCKKVKETYPDKDIWLWTGHRWEQVKFYPIMKYIDILVDGQFEEETRKKDLQNKSDPHYRGSSNQRIIDVKNSLQSKPEGIVLWNDQAVIEVNQTGKRGCGE